jgi:hypothetical protein
LPQGRFQSNHRVAFGRQRFCDLVDLFLGCNLKDLRKQLFFGLKVPVDCSGGHSCAFGNGRYAGMAEAAFGDALLGALNDAPASLGFAVAHFFRFAVSHSQSF